MGCESCFMCKGAWVDLVQVLQLRMQKENTTRYLLESSGGMPDAPLESAPVVNTE